MNNFFMRALKKLDKLTPEQCRDLLVSAGGEITRLETVLDSLFTGILVCDEKHNLLMANKCAQWMVPMNYNKGELLWLTIQYEPLAEFFLYSLLNDDRVLEKEIDVEHRGRNRLLSISIVPLVQNRKITGSLIYIEDITEKRKGEALLRRAENLASLTTLAAAVAHEIKNPLGSISIYLQLLQKTQGKKSIPPKTAEKYFKILNDEVDRLNCIVVDFLFAVRPMTLELREFDINKLISDMIEFVGLEMEQANINCVLEFDEKIPKILIDGRYMKQALLNLIKNAQAAMPEGGLLTITTKHIDNEIRIAIRDTGRGISEKNLAKIFEPYFTTSQTGTGLGLTHVFKIIKEHHGEITVDSKPGKGTVFEIALPLYQKEMRMIAYNASEGV